jgi:hypothetical protein
MVARTSVREQKSDCFEVLKQSLFIYAKIEDKVLHLHLKKTVP